MCDSGYGLVGNSVRICGGSTGVWSGSSATCTGKKTFYLSNATVSSPSTSACNVLFKTSYLIAVFMVILSSLTATCTVFSVSSYLLVRNSCLQSSGFCLIPS